MRSTSRGVGCCALCALMAVSLAAANTSLAADRPIEVIAATGQQAPGTEDGVVFSTLGLPVLNSAGIVAFDAEVTGPNVSEANEAGIWIGGTAESLELLARGGDPIPDDPDDPQLLRAEQTGFTPAVLRIDDSGRVFSAWSLQGDGFGGFLDGGIYSFDSAASPQTFARTGNVAPGTGGGSFEGGCAPTIGICVGAFDLPVVNGHGTALIVGRTDNIRTGLFTNAGGNGLGAIALNGDPAPGYADGVTFDGFTPGLFEPNWPTINDSGEFAFWGSVEGPGVTRDVNDDGLWMVNASGEFELLVRTGQAVAEELGGGEFNWISTFPSINEAGDVLFASNIRIDGPLSFESAHWAQRHDGGLELIAREGEPAPGVIGDAKFARFRGEFPLPISSNGETAFVAEIAGGGLTPENQFGIWTDVGSDGLRLLAQSGDAAPAAGANAQLLFDDLTPLGFNELGQTAFITDLTGAGINANNDLALWLEVAPGNLELLLQSGDEIAIDDDDLRTVSNFSSSRPRAMKTAAAAS